MILQSYSNEINFEFLALLKSCAIQQIKGLAEDQAADMV